MNHDLNLNLPSKITMILVVTITVSLLLGRGAIPNDVNHINFEINYSFERVTCHGMHHKKDIRNNMNTVTHLANGTLK